MNLRLIFSLLSFERRYLSQHIGVIDLRYSVCVPNIHLDGGVSQICHLGPSFYLMLIIG